MSSCCYFLFFFFFEFTFHIFGIEECRLSGRQGGAGTSDPVCVCQPRREPTHFRCFTQTDTFSPEELHTPFKQLHGSDASAGSLQHPLPPPSSTLVLSFFLLLFSEASNSSKLRKWERLLLDGLSGCFPAFCPVHAGIGYIFAQIIIIL